jgi:hypothetical protein
MIKKALILLVAFLLNMNAWAHNAHEYHTALREWHVANSTIHASFLMYRNGQVYLENENGNTVKYPLAALVEGDQLFVQDKIHKIESLNKQGAVQPAASSSLAIYFFLAGALLCVGLALIFVLRRRRAYKALAVTAFLAAVLCGFSSRSLRLLSMATNPATIDSAFVPFKPNVSTFWNSTYFYVESLGIPTTHTMMVGIASNGWQQQVPIPQCYKGSNAWPIPLNPSMAAQPIPVDQNHFTRGAIAIAVNGVPIFNPYTNAGVDAYLDGQLDNYGGHSGRADDYHYHTAPLHLYGYTSSSLPIAYAFDGFPVYGSVEPDGSAMQTLDANHGHFGTNGVYHYHGTSNAPYMIAQMAGQVTEDTSKQLIPQAQSTAIRPGTNPLPGALITSCVPNSNNNGYNLAYTLSGQNYQVNYSWTPSGVYTYNFVNPNGSTTTQTYNGFVPCAISSTVNEIKTAGAAFEVWPNPATDEVIFHAAHSVKLADITGVKVYAATGQQVLSQSGQVSRLDVRALAPGIYSLVIRTERQTYSQKLVVR